MKDDENKFLRGIWDWNRINDDRWLSPASVVYALAVRWKNQNKHYILDLGCGLGRNSLYFYEQGFKVAAIDGAQSAIDRLKEVCEQKKYIIDIRLEDMHSLPFDNESFDAVFSLHVIYHTDSKGILKVISEIYRVLKPGGEIFLTFNSKNSPNYVNNISSKIDENTIIKQEGIEKGIVHYFADEKDVKKLLENFDIQKFFYVEDIRLNGSRSCHYYVIAKK
ncbi:class I SAM-dependent methyltransferase [Petrotoga sp. 9PWA.NaAc.5.4]|uniref:class I SAM-dependent methyltransferase n=1 Tax=Petrotoga sp. 9PWA.NaAc.5.4 TaxID=1434328 RepID=UPI000EFBA0F0|nr:class I SAM-dependent methyltransferase [Petrotoga sp. 9PWA.NaAc.5.4]